MLNKNKKVKNNTQNPNTVKDYTTTQCYSNHRDVTCILRHW